MIEWPERFTNRLLVALYGLFLIFQVVLGCIGASAVTVYWIGNTKPRVEGLLHIYFGYAAGFMYCVVAAAAVGLAVGFAGWLTRPLIIRMGPTAVGRGPSNIPFRDADSAVIQSRRFRAPVLWVTVDGRRRRFGLPKDPGMVLEVERILRSSGVRQEEAQSPPLGRAVQPRDDSRKMGGPSAFRRDGGVAEQLARGDSALRWSEGFVNNELFRWMLPILGYFVRLVFAFSGVGALVVHAVATIDPGIREKLFREYFSLDFVLVLYCLIFFGCGGLFVGFRRSRREPGRVRLTANRLELYERQISLFRVSAAEILLCRLRGPQLRLLVEGQWVGVGLPRDEGQIGEIERLLRDAGKGVKVVPGGAELPEVGDGS